MKFTRNKGDWEEYSTELDDIVYQLYLNENEHSYTWGYPISQLSIVNVYSPLKTNKYNYLYNIAEKIIRKEKLEKINKNNDGK